MAVNHEILSDYEVVTAEWAQDHLMDQVIVKADTEGDLASLPNEVKQAYTMNTGTLWVRDNNNAWKRGGGAAEVSETAPSNPSVGQLWVKPTEVLPLPWRGYMKNASTAITATSWSPVPSADTIYYDNDSGKPVMCMVTYSCWLAVASSTGSLRSRLYWVNPDASTGNSLDNGGGGWGSVPYLSSASGSAMNVWQQQSITFAVVLQPGTTYFQAHAHKSGTTTVANCDYPSLAVVPMQWADAYEAGVS